MIQMGLFDKFRKPKWQHEDWEVRSEAVKELDDQKILAEIAKNDSDYTVRREAVKKISDQSALIDIAKNASDWEVRREAVKKITDESALIDIAKNDSDWEVRREAVKKITDESALIDIAKNDSKEYVCEEAVKKITDESALIDIAKNNSWGFARLEAVRKIRDESVLIDIAKNDSKEYVREEAVKKISDKSALADITKNESIIDLKEFEKLNNSTSSIYNLDNNKVLFIDRNGNNYLSWKEYDKLIRKMKDKIHNHTKEKDGQWAKGNESDGYWYDGIIFISENFKNTNKLPKYVSKCEFVDKAAMLDPMTDRRTEGENYYLYTFENVRTIVINGLKHPNSLNLNDIPAKTIVFKNCDFSNLDKTNFIYDGTSPKIILGDESSINPIIDVLPKNCRYLGDIEDTK